MRAAIGIVLKQSIKSFHIFNEYFLLPKIYPKLYIHHKNHITYLFMRINDSHVREKNFKGILICMLKVG